MGIHPPFDESSASNHVIKDFTNLSRSISHRFRYKNYTVVSLPKGMEIIDGEFCVAEKFQPSRSLTYSVIGGIYQSLRVPKYPMVPWSQNML